MKDFGFFPQVFTGLIAVMIALQVLPVLLSPFTTAVGIALIVMAAIWFVGKRNRSKHGADHKKEHR